MKNLKSYEIRQMWLDFFTSKGHKVIESASLVPHDDPTLLWINAGVAPLKKYFDGREIPENPRMTNAQKSIRTNDIDNVGRTSRHHTFFEMLGNFSIGDYFRGEVIPWATELLFSKEWFDIDKNLIYITYYPDDLDTFNTWVKAGIDPTHLIPLEDNFWEIGEGPCGPDTEIFFDRGEKYDPEHLGIRMLEEDIDNDRYIEIWNIVLSQFNSKTGMARSEYPELPSKNIDTGCGLERLASIFQGTDTNFETDLFWPLIEHVEKLSGVKYDENKMAFRVIADHIRSVTFACADGALISNEGRGYVLRRILRRAVRYGRKLGIKDAFLYNMVDIVVDIMKQFYPYLIDKAPLVKEIIKKEELAFIKTLSNGEKKLSDIIEKNIANNVKELSGKDAFLLYDTFGFPIELTMEACEEQGYKVNIDEFTNELNAQKQRARAARSSMQSMASQNEDFMAFNKESKFTGYDTLTGNAKVIGLFKDGKAVNEGCGEMTIVFDETPFYAEMGGQIGDTGTIILNEESFNVVNTFRLPNGEHAHVTDMKDTNIKLNDEVYLEVTNDERDNICKNHSATHLLNEALRKVLGSHVAQHGSLVTNDRLRFDFNHYNKISKEEILQFEKVVKEEIKKGHAVVTKELPIEEAKKTGAQAVFGEKYGDIVRVVDMGYSIEFCGGTHVKDIADINDFAVINLESKGSGVYRVEGVTGDNVASSINELLKPVKDEINQTIAKINNLVKTAKGENIDLVTPKFNEPSMVGSYADFINYKETLEEVKKVLFELDKEYNQLKLKQASSDYKKYLNDVNTINNVPTLVFSVNGMDPNALKDIIDKLACDIKGAVIFAANVLNDTKVLFTCKSDTKLVGANILVKEAAMVCQGNGGGRPDFATAGGKDSSKVNDAILKVKSLIEGALN